MNLKTEQNKLRSTKYAEGKEAKKNKAQCLAETLPQWEGVNNA